MVSLCLSEGERRESSSGPKELFFNQTNMRHVLLNLLTNSNHYVFMFGLVSEPRLTLNLGASCLTFLGPGLQVFPSTWMVSSMLVCVSVLPPCSWGCRSMPYVLAPCLSRICLQCSHAFRLSRAGQPLGLSSKKTESSFVVIHVHERKRLNVTWLCSCIGTTINKVIFVT